MLKIIIISFFSLFIASSFEGDVVNEEFKTHVLNEVNRVRTTGCFCGTKYMPPVNKVTWNSKLYSSALRHAKDMSRNNYFSHFSLSGKDVGDRLDELDYKWQMVGENLGEGQKIFDEVMEDWLESQTHCEMLMSGKVDEMGVAKHGRFWVQHFGKQIPENTYVGKKRITSSQ